MNSERLERFHALFLEVLHESGVTDAVQVTNVYQEQYEMGACETCSYTDYEVDISYVDVNGNRKSYTKSGKLTDLLA